LAGAQANNLVLFFCFLGRNMRKYLQILKNQVFINSTDCPGFQGFCAKQHGKKETTIGSQVEAFLPEQDRFAKKVQGFLRAWA
jgi:hypothetical protein